MANVNCSSFVKLTRAFGPCEGIPLGKSWCWLLPNFLQLCMMRLMCLAFTESGKMPILSCLDYAAAQPRYACDGRAKPDAPR